MDKETLSQYGWIVICIIIIALMLGLATPFGKYIGDATFKAMDSFRSKTEATLDIKDANKSKVNGTTIIEVKNGDEVPAFPNDGVTYSEWNTEADGTGVSYNPGDKVVVQGAHDILYAIQKKNNAPFKVPYATYVANNANYSDDPLEYYQVQSGTVSIESFKYMVQQFGSLDAAILQIASNSGYQGTNVKEALNYPVYENGPTIEEFVMLNFGYSYDDFNYIFKYGYEVEGDFSSIKSTYNGYPVSQIAINGFSNASDLKVITIPSNINYLNENSFSNCTNLTSITIHSGVNTIDGGVFNGCTNLETINYTGTIAQWNAISKGSENFGHGMYKDTQVKATNIHCTDGDVPVTFN